MLKVLTTPTSYDETYYENGIAAGVSCYENYRWLPELTIPLCAEMCEILEIKPTDTILDFGCAKGYMVKAFRLLHRQAFGYDISQYAKDNACIELEDEYTDYYQWVIAKDVFEHLMYTELDHVLSSLACDNIFVVVPLGRNGKYVNPDDEKDKTHIIRENRTWWVNRIMAYFRNVQSWYRFGHMKEGREMESYAFIRGSR